MNKIVSAAPLSSTEAFARIGTLMTNWVTRLSERDIARNSGIRTELEALGRSTSYAQQRSNASRIAVLNASVKAVRTITRLKSTIPALASVLDGSPKMDTGAALMLLAQHADFSVPEDETASDVLIGLIRTARPAPVTPLPISVTPLPIPVTPLPISVTPLPIPVTPLPIPVAPLPLPIPVAPLPISVAARRAKP